MPFRRRTESVSTVLSTTSTVHESGKCEEIVEPRNPLLSWLEQDCPSDVLPKILAYCGPQQVAALAKTNTTWQARIVGQEPVWRVLCEELYKVRYEKEKMGYISAFVVWKSKLIIVCLLVIHSCGIEVEAR